MAAQVGSITEFKGDVTLQKGNKTVKVQAAPTPLDEKDIVVTGPKGRARITLTDGSTLSLGASSHFSVTSYHFETSGRIQAKLSVSDGGFRAVTGKIGKLAPSRFTVKTATATIGIRGTDFAGIVSPSGDTIACVGGAIGVAGSSGAPVTVAAGSITSVAPGKTPTAPRAYTPDEINNLLTVAGMEKDEIQNLLSPKEANATKQEDASGPKKAPNQATPTAPNRGPVKF